jgi:hypothetical protein
LSLYLTKFHAKETSFAYLCTTPLSHIEKVEVELHALLTSAHDQRSVSGLGRFTPGIHWLGVIQSRYGGGEKETRIQKSISCPCWKSNPDNQPAAQSLYD